MKKATHLLSLVLACVVALCVLTACGGGGGGGSTSFVDEYRQQTLQLVNAQRESAGRPSLTMGSTQMNSAAQKRAQELESSFSGTRPNGSSWATVLTEYGVSYKTAIEFEAKNYTTPAALVNAGMNDSGMKADLLSSSYTQMGVGCYVSPTTGQTFWVLILTSGSSATTATPTPTVKPTVTPTATPTAKPKTIKFESSKTAALLAKLKKGYTAKYTVSGSARTYIYAPETGSYEQFSSDTAELYLNQNSQSYLLDLVNKTYSSNGHCGYFVDGIVPYCSFDNTTWTVGTTNGYYSESYHYPGDELFSATDITYCFDGAGEPKYLICKGEGGTYAITSLSYTYDVSKISLNGYTDKDAPKTVSISTAYTGSGSTSGGGTYTVGSSVTVSAAPASNYEFKGWKNSKNEIVSSSATYTFTASESCTLTAVFVKDCTVTVTADPSFWSGWVSGGGKYSAGDTVTVKGCAPSGYEFKGWQKNGVIVSTDENYTFTVSEDCTLTAILGKVYSIYVKAEPSSYSNLVSGEGKYSAGKTVTITASVPAGYKFKGWKQVNTIVSTNLTYTFTAAESCTLTAVFEKSAGYNGATAASWGIANYKNNYGLCAEFVWNCVKQGGLSISKQTGVGYLYRALLNTGCFTEYTPKSRGGDIYVSDNPGKVSVGDVVIYQAVGGSQDGVYKHAAIIYKIENGVAYIVQRNSSYAGRYAAGYKDNGSYSWKYGNIKTIVLHYNGN